MVSLKAACQQVLTALRLGLAQRARASHDAAADTMPTVEKLRVHAYRAQRPGRHVF